MEKPGLGEPSTTELLPSRIEKDGRDDPRTDSLIFQLMDGDDLSALLDAVALPEAETNGAPQARTPGGRRDAATPMADEVLTRIEQHGAGRQPTAGIEAL